MTLIPNNDLLNLSNQTAIVTGGAMGIGFGIVTRLAMAGANVVIADINQQVGQDASNQLNSQGYKTIFVKTDVSNESDVKNSIGLAVSTYGSLNILVNNAGIYPTVPVMQMPLEQFQKVIDINLKSVFIYTTAAAEVMINQGQGGKIINITSIDSLHPSSIGLAAYDASKHGLWGFTKNVALELAPHHIYINNVAPGGISTPGTGMGTGEVSPEMKQIIDKFINKIPLKKMGEPDDIGKAVLFLASDLSSYMTGSQIVVDGGVLLS